MFEPFRTVLSQKKFVAWLYNGVLIFAAGPFLLAGLLALHLIGPVVTGILVVVLCLPPLVLLGVACIKLSAPYWQTPEKYLLLVGLLLLSLGSTVLPTLYLAIVNGFLPFAMLDSVQLCWMLAVYFPVVIACVVKSLKIERPDDGYDIWRIDKKLCLLDQFSSMVIYFFAIYSMAILGYGYFIPFLKTPIWLIVVYEMLLFARLVWIRVRETRHAYIDRSERIVLHMISQQMQDFSVHAEGAIIQPNQEKAFHPFQGDSHEIGEQQKSPAAYSLEPYWDGRYVDGGDEPAP